MSAAGLEAPRELRNPGDIDEVAFSWAAAAAGLQGLARAGAQLDGSWSVAAVFAGDEPVAPPGPVELAVDEPLERWSAHGDGFALEFEAITPPAELPVRSPANKAGALAGYIQLCQVRGTVGERPVRGLGHRGRGWGNTNWEKVELKRRISAWLDDGTGVVLAGVRPAGAQSHADEAVWGAMWDGGRVRPIEDPRVSSTTDGSGRVIRAGLELWVEESDEYPFRAIGEATGHTALTAGPLRIECAFFRWHVDGRQALGRYDVLRRA
jgi:hypothetical protein